MPFTDIPPSYDSSISRETWNIIAPYIPSPDLCACCLVSSKWHSIFVPFLWGDPASHFGIANDAVYVALTRFKRTLRKARPSVRGLTHTLHLPPALSEIYGGPNPTWLREVLEYLPNLQSLIVTKLPFFDHHSLVALKPTQNGRRPSNEEPKPQQDFALKLLLASSEPNTTSVGLAIALPRFPNLVYLDLSYTKAARDGFVLLALSSLHDLQVIKLRGVGLRDAEAEILANVITIRVRLLDLRENLLTDMAVRSLMQACFLPLEKDPEVKLLNTRHVEDWPVGMAPGPDFFSLDTLRGEELDHELLKQLTNPLTGRLAFEDIPHRGLTHLYIADNHLSVEGVSSLLKSERLHILDAGSVDTVKIIARTKSLSSSTGYVDEVKFPGAEKLIPALAQCASKNLTHLRVDHALVTAKLDGMKEISPPKGRAIEVTDLDSITAELPVENQQVFEAPASAHYPVEMPATGDLVFELDATPARPRYELVGDSIHFAISPPVNRKPGDEFPETQPVLPIKGEGAYAPEVVQNGTFNGSHDDSDETHLNENGTYISTESSEESTNSTGRSIFSPVSPMTPAVARTFPLFRTQHTPTFADPIIEDEAVATAPPSTPKTLLASAAAIPTSSSVLPPTTAPPKVQQSVPPRPSTQRQARIDVLLSRRPKALSSLQTNGSTHRRKITGTAASTLTYLHPAALPNLRSLILTNVPISVTTSSKILESLKSFISACADEYALSRLLAKTDYSLPPGRARYAAEQQAARRLFALRTIILEMETPDHLSERTNQRAWEHSRQRLSMSKSSTGDRDSENLWTAAADDFSFFGEEGEEKDECGIYEHDPEKYFPTAHIDEKILLSPEVEQDRAPNTGGNSPHGSFNSGSMSPIHNMNMGVGRSQTLLRSPRDLPLGRNRRSSNEMQRNQPDLRRSIVELAGSTPASKPPTSNPIPKEPPKQESTLDLVAELAKWRKERKKAHEDETARYRHIRQTSLGSGHSRSSSEGTLEIDMPFVEGYWEGEIKVVRNAVPKGRTGVVDMYGNYFEKGYLYP